MAKAGNLRQLNTQSIRASLTKEPMTKKEIALITGLSFPTVSKTIDQLVESNEVREKGLEQSTGGRCAMQYEINPDYGFSLLLRLEGDQIDWSVHNRIGQKMKERTEHIEHSPLQTIDLIITSVKKEFSALCTLIIGIAAMVNQGTITGAFSWTELQNLELSSTCEKKYELPTVLVNDMKSAAAGYWTQHAQEKRSATVCIYLGENGIGACAVLEGKVLHGFSEFAGELHYLPIDEHNREYATKGFESVDIIEYYGKIIQSYTVILNPERIVLYQNHYIENKLAQIKAYCKNRLPESCLPGIEISNHFQADYVYGQLQEANKQINLQIERREF